MTPELPKECQCRIDWKHVPYEIFRCSYCLSLDQTIAELRRELDGVLDAAVEANHKALEYTLELKDAIDALQGKLERIRTLCFLPVGADVVAHMEWVQKGNPERCETLQEKLKVAVAALSRIYRNAWTIEQANADAKNALQQIQESRER